MGRFGQSLLNETHPPISGLDKSVLISPRRLHFTLGVMSLASPSTAVDSEGTTDPRIQSRTLDDAVGFLESLKPHVDDLLRVSATGSVDQAQKIRVPLNSMDTMKLEKDGAAHVLWVGPRDGNLKDTTGEEVIKLRRVCGKLDDSLQ
jgi:activating signal cointegrator complex subunit 1